MTNSKEYNAKYYREHKEEILARKKENYRKNSEAYKQRARQRVQRDREGWNAYMREWRRKRKEKKAGVDGSADV